MRLKPSFPRRHPNRGKAASPETLCFDGIRLPLAADRVIRDPTSTRPSIQDALTPRGDAQGSQTGPGPLDNLLANRGQACE